MTRHRIRQSVAWGLAALLGIGSLAAWVRAIPDPDPVQAPVIGALPPLRPPDSTALERSAAELRSHDPFRWGHLPAPVVYDPDAPMPGTAPPPRPPAPTLTLTGMVGGPPWVVMIDGIPGREGSTLLKVGAQVNGIRLKAVRGDTAFLSGLDTNWTLSTKRTTR